MWVCSQLHTFMLICLSDPKERKINCNEWPFCEWEKHAVNRKVNFLNLYFYKKSAPYTVMLFEAKRVVISNEQFQSDYVQALFCLQLNILLLFTYLHYKSVFSNLNLLFVIFSHLISAWTVFVCTSEQTSRCQLSSAQNHLASCHYIKPLSSKSCMMIWK